MTSRATLVIPVMGKPAIADTVDYYISRWPDLPIIVVDMLGDVAGCLARRFKGRSQACVTVVDLLGAQYFNKSTAINIGAAYVKTELILVCDGDILIDQSTLADWLENSRSDEQTTLANVNESDGSGSRPGPGVCCISTLNFVRVGGYCSEFLGWGFEDHDFNVRVEANGIGRRVCGSGVHISHDDEERVRHYPSKDRLAMRSENLDLFEERKRTRTRLGSLDSDLRDHLGSSLGRQISDGARWSIERPGWIAAHHDTDKPNVYRQPLAVSAAARAQLLKQRPFLIWLTGLSGAGKSTIANLVCAQYHSLGYATCLLDGDNIRHRLSRDLGFTEADRREHVRRVAEVARLMVDAGLVVIAALISPYRSDREVVRAMFKPGEFFEVFVDVPVSVAEARDPKGLYAKARNGDLLHFTGVSAPYESPTNPEIHLHTEVDDALTCANTILSHTMETRVGRPPDTVNLTNMPVVS